MKNTPFYFVLATCAIFILAAVGFKSMNKTVLKPTANKAANGFSLVELFTSEGCSSCPAAEETVAGLLRKNTANVYVLSYHVDYWNKLGWKDEFSDASYTQRQNEYAAAFHLNSIYTPQVVVNGSAEFVGSDEKRLSTAVQNNLLKEPVQIIHFDAKTNANLVTVLYDIEGFGTEAQLLNIALVQPEATVSVKRGENEGRTLHHLNIVRYLKTVNAGKTGSVSLEIPAGLQGKPLQVVAFTQAKQSFLITAAEQKTL